MRLPADQPDAVAQAAQAIRAGRLVAIPTETVYGLAADATNPDALARIFAVKNRPTFDPLILHVPDATQAQQLVTAWPDAAQQLADACWPGPLTLVLPKQTHVPDLATAGLHTVAVRVPNHPVTRQLLQELRVPLAAPSANRFGQISPTDASHVAEELAPHLQPGDLILDAGPTITGVESTVVSLLDPNQPTLLRPGGVPVEQLEQALGQPLASPATTSDTQPQAAPGMLTRHYAPRTPLHLVDQLPEPMPTGAATLDLPLDPTLAAAVLFARMRELDADPAVQSIYAKRFPPDGLGRAINDRLTRASKR